MTIEVTAKKVEDAIAQGLSQLGATLDDVTVEVVDAGGLFRKAKVKLTLDKPEAEEPAEAKEHKSAPKEHKAPEDEKPAEKPEHKEEPKPAAPQKTEKKQAVKPVKNVQAGAADQKEKSEKPQAPQKQDSEQKAQSAKSKKQSAKKDKSASGTQDTQSAQDVRAAQDTAKDTSEEAQEEKSKRRIRKEDLEAAGHAFEFVKKTVELMGFSGIDIVADAETGEHIDITAPEGDDSLIIGRHGETLSALTYLAETCARAEKCRLNIVVDCNGYRERRAKSLTSMARRRAHESAAKRRRIKLEPMDRIDRRTVHMALADDEYVTTESEGKEPYRCVVIVPKAGEREPRKDDRRDRKPDRRERAEKSGPRPKRPVFDMKLYGKVGHNDNVTAEDTEKVDTED